MVASSLAEGTVGPTSHSSSISEKSSSGENCQSKINARNVQIDWIAASAISKLWMPRTGKSILMDSNRAFSGRVLV
jgi:hypothetical protein